MEVIRKQDRQKEIENIKGLQRVYTHLYCLRMFKQLIEFITISHTTVFIELKTNYLSLLRY